MQDLLHVAGMAARLGVAVSSNSQPLPVIADADTGFGGAPQVVSTISLMKNRPEQRLNINLGPND